MTNYVCKLSTELQKKARDELNECPETRAAHLEAFRNLILGNKALHTRTDDLFLLRFLRARKFNVERANQLLINYHTIRAENAEVFKNLVPSTVKHVLDAGVTCVLPHPDKEGRQIVYFRPAKWNPQEFPIWDILRTNILTVEKLVENEETQINGVVLIGNMEGLGWEHAKSMDREYARIFLKTIQESFPLRFKGMNMVNEPTLVDYILAIVKPFMKEKFSSRMKFYGKDLNALHKTFNPAILPEDIGGDLPSGDDIAQVWKERLLASEQTFVEMGQYKIDVVKQNITKARTKDENKTDAEVVGTFKKLNIN